MSISSSESVISRAPLVAEALGDLEQLLLDDPEHALLVAEDRAQLGDPLGMSACSCLIVSASSAVSCDRRRSRIAWAWIVGELEALDQLPARAASRSREARISSMTASRLSSAISRPSRMCARASTGAARASCGGR